MLFDLAGKNALITGATGGIGAAIAHALHAQGATVALSGTRGEVLDTLQRKLGERSHIFSATSPGPRKWKSSFRSPRRPWDRWTSCQQCGHHARHARAAHEG